MLSIREKWSLCSTFRMPLNRLNMEEYCDGGRKCKKRSKTLKLWHSQACSICDWMALGRLGRVKKYLDAILRSFNSADLLNLLPLWLEYPWKSNSRLVHKYTVFSNSKKLVSVSYLKLVEYSCNASSFHSFVDVRNSGICKKLKSGVCWKYFHMCNKKSQLGN